jgi:FKBP-type peptidyl-prolyl cis-trans isomerase FklB
VLGHTELNMKSALLSIASSALVATSLHAADAISLKTDQDKVSYSIGLNIGRNFKAQGVDANPDIVAAGIRDMLKGNKPLLTEDEAIAVMSSFQKDLRAKQTARASEAGDKNKKEGEVFLAANKTKDGVKTTASGLQYKVVKQGTGKLPKDTDTVKTHYRGTLIDGTEFDSSYKRNEPTTFPVNGVIKGWTEALQLMPVGSKWQLFIPSNLAYGERGAGQAIGPNATLIFDIELLDIEAAK